jgi:hypothetical protein
MVNDGLKMILEMIEKLLSQPAIERREVLESYHHKLAEILHATESSSTNPTSE